MHWKTFSSTPPFTYHMQTATSCIKKMAPRLSSKQPIDKASWIYCLGRSGRTPTFKAVTVSQRKGDARIYWELEIWFTEGFQCPTILDSRDLTRLMMQQPKNSENSKYLSTVNVLTWRIQRILGYKPSVEKLIGLLGCCCSEQSDHLHEKESCGKTKHANEHREIAKSC